MSALICLLFVPQLALPPAAQAEADDGSAPGNLVLNGGFEETQEGAAGWLNGIQPSHWGHWIAAGTPMLAVDEEIKRSGERSVRLEGPAGTTSRAAVSQPILVEVGKTYRISGWIRTEEVSNAAVLRFQMKRNGEGNLLINVGSIQGTHDWTYMERLLTVPDNAALPATLTIEVFLESGTGKVWIDDIRVEEPASLLQNGSFEQTAYNSAWLNHVGPAGWSQWVPTGHPILALDDQISRSGGRSASIEAPSGTVGRAAITQEIPVEVGKTYRISGWVRTQEVSNAALIRFQMRREGTSNLLIHVGTLSGTNDWTYMERLLTVPDNAALPARLAIEMFLETGSGKVWFDLRSAIETGFA